MNAQYNHLSAEFNRLQKSVHDLSNNHLVLHDKVHAPVKHVSKPSDSNIFALGPSTQIVDVPQNAKFAFISMVGGGGLATESCGAGEFISRRLVSLEACTHILLCAGCGGNSESPNGAQSHVELIGDSTKKCIYAAGGLGGTGASSCDGSHGFCYIEFL